MTKKNTDFETLLSDFQSAKINLNDFLKALSNETDENFGLNLTKLIEKIPSIHTRLKEIMADSTNLNDDIVFPAFYSLGIFYRKMKEVSKLNDLIESQRARFSSRAMYIFLLAISLRESGKLNDLPEAIIKMRIVTEKIPNNAAILSGFAGTVVEAFEENILTDLSILEEAIAKIKIAITNNPKYAKYYCIYGRLIANKGEYSDACRLIKKAIDLEDSSKKDYSIRIGDYQYYLSNINYSKQNKRVSDKINSITRQIDDFKKEVKDITNVISTRNLEFLGFFAALVSFIIGSIQIIGKQSGASLIIPVTITK